MNYLKHKRQKTVSPLQMYDRFGNEHIKSEPKVDKTPPHQIQNSPLQVYEQDQSIQEASYQWAMQPNMGMPGPSHVQYGQENIQWNQNYNQIASNIQPMSPNHQMAAMTNLHTLGPNVQGMQMSMGQMERISPMHGGMSPGMGHVSPGMGHVSPGMGHVSPGMGHVSPGMGHVSPMSHASPAYAGHVSPNLVQQQMYQEDLMEQTPGDSTSLTNLLRADGIPPLHSGDFSLSSLLDRTPDLSDSLNRLSTKDLLH